MNDLTKTDGSILAGVDLLEIIAKEYGIIGATMKRLPGWCDVTFLVSDPSNGGRQLIFKIFVDVFTSPVEQIEGEIAMIQFLEQRGFPVPKIMATTKGSFYGEADFKDDQGSGTHKKRFRLQTYIEGEIIGKLLTPDLCRQMGDLAGRVDVALADFKHAYFDKGEPNFLINFTDDLKTIDLIPKLPDQHIQKIAHEYLKLYDDQIGSKIDQFPMQQIHCDFHGYNLIVSSGDSAKIIGLIDFSDARKTLRVVEAANALVNILLFSSDRISSVDNFLKAYEKHVKLLNIEKEALLVTIVGRFIQAKSVHNFFMQTLPGYNAGYLDNIYGASWDLADRLLSPTSDEHKFFRNFAQPKMQP